MIRPAPRGTILQTAYVVRDLDHAIATWIKTFGAGPFFKAAFKFDESYFRGAHAPTDVTVGVAALGDTLIELIQPNTPAPSVFNEVLERDGEGFHHCWMACDDLDAECARFAAAGHPTIGHTLMGPIGRCAFIDATTVLGSLVELIEMQPAGWAVMAAIGEAHTGWNGQDPIRPYPRV